MGHGVDVVVVGAGILGLAGAYHILQENRGMELLLLDRLPGAGQGTTARSAAAYRDMFASPVNRFLSRGSISFYEGLQDTGISLDLMKIGYLWLLTPDQTSQNTADLEGMSRDGVSFETLEPRELHRLLPALEVGDIHQGILGHRCGILNPHRLSHFYEEAVLRWGGRFQYGAAVTGFLRAPPGRIRGVMVGDKEIPAGRVIVATGPWMGDTMTLAGESAPVVPVKRQLFAVAAQEGALKDLLYTGGCNTHHLLPFTILPGGAYLRPMPAANSFIIGFANRDQPPGLEEHPIAEPDFFQKRIRPQLERYFPIFQGIEPSYAWAGFYEDHPPDLIPFVDWLGGALVVGGGSGSGIMKADSLGRVVAGLLLGKEEVELGDGKAIKVADLGLKDRKLPPEEFVI